MDLGSIFANFGSDPWANYASVLSGLGGLYGGIQGIGNNNAMNGQIQSALGANNAALQQQAAQLQNQVNLERQQAQDMYNRSSADVQAQNAQIQGQIDQGTANLAALSDPNSAYMTQARQAIERKDAASGRNSQWGDREVQLAALLSDQVNKYSPAINQAITQARNQISSNNQGLASLYNTANNPGSTSAAQQLAAIQAQIQQAQAINTTGRQAQNAATNSVPNFLNSLGGTIKGLGGLFGGNANSNYGITDYYGNSDPVWGLNSGLTNGGGSTYNLTGGSFDLGSGYNISNPYGWGTSDFGSSIWD